MVNIQTQIPANAVSNKQTTSPKTTKTSIFYINDLHGQVANMERIETAIKGFDEFAPSSKTDKLKLSSGDTLLGEDLSLNKAAIKFLNTAGITATAVGNHELDISPKNLVEFTKDAKCKLLGLNANIEDKNQLKNKIVDSYVEEKDGNKYGIIGLMPFDLFKRIKYKERFDGLTIDKLDETTKEVQAEVDKLKKQGIDKIIVLSHIGYANDIKLANSVEGIDVILGGHSHDLVEGIKEGKNLFYSKKTGEPTIITQAGKDGNYFGVLNLEFNDKGVITKAQNNVTKSNIFPKNPLIKYVFDTILGKSEVVGEIVSAPPAPTDQLTRENPHADFMTDAMKAELNTDIAILNSANLRGAFEVGKITSRDISSITPFKNKMTVMTINEKELVDAIKLSGKSLTTPDKKPGILQVSGVKYKMNKSGKLLEVKFVDKNGVETPINVDNPNTFKTYTLAIDDFYASGKDDFTMLKKMDKLDKLCDFDKDKLTADYIKHLNKPIEIKADGRIQIVD